MRRAAIVVAVVLLVLFGALVYQDAAQDQHLWRCQHTPEVETHCPPTVPDSGLRISHNVIGDAG